MDFSESFRISMAALAANRLRSVLTTLGIIIGVGAVIGLVSLGNGVEDYITREFKELGSNLVFVFSSDPESPTRNRVEPLTMREGEALVQAVPSVSEAAFSFGLQGSIVKGSERIDADVVGQSENFFRLRSWFPLAGGRTFTQEDLDANARVVILGPSVNAELFGDKEASSVGEIVRINDINFTVVGVLPELSSDITGENDLVYIPLTTAQRRMADGRASDGSFKVDVYQMQVVSEDAMDRAVLEIEDFMREAHDIRFDGEEDYTVVSQSDVLATLEAVTGVLTIFLGMIAGIALLVGGIGIMNIMLVSVTERTREIGLRKAVGARGADILIQFLIESIVLSLIGGLLGVGVGWLITVVGMQAVPDLNLAITPFAIILATSVSSFIGVFFGVIPANRAARMKPIDALSYE